MLAVGSPLFSVVVPCRDEGEMLARTLESIAASRGPSYEVIVVDDQSRDPVEPHNLAGARLVRGPGLGPAAARNAGAAVAKAEFLVFVDAHVLVPPDWLEILLAIFRRYPGLAAVSPGIAAEDNPRRTGYGLTWDARLNVRWLSRPLGTLAEVPLLPGGCLAVRRQVFLAAGGFDRGFRGYGHEDEEISLRLWLLGHQLAATGEFSIVHRFRPRFPYLVKLGEMYYNLLRMGVIHFSEERMAKLLFLVRKSIDPTLLVARLMVDGSVMDRERLARERVRDDGWFFERFGIPF